ncbi:MAG: LytTR family DNA-binding domain-containing protein [Pyramidobacter sp.]|nr:LytTR family DNA-binding domain-containing protein [Pyramidobacter sp.]
MRIAVIDDESPARRELCHQIRSFIPEASIDEASSGGAALEMVCKTPYDLVFLDINLGDISGTSIAVAVKKINADAQIVFATAYPEYAVKAFELGVTDYILKPFDPERIRDVLERCQAGMAAFAQKTPVERFAAAHDGRIVLISTDTIISIESEARGVVVHTTDGDYTDRKSLRECEARLACEKFFRISKSHIVNLEHVVEIVPWYNKTVAVKMRALSQALPVGRNKKNELYQRLNAL